MKNIESEWLKNDAGRDERWYDERIDLLRGFVTDERAAVLERTLADRTRYMTVCMENTFHPQNASALVRQRPSAYRTYIRSRRAASSTPT